MDDTLNMSVSGIVEKDGKKLIYIQFSDESHSAEGCLPDGKIISSVGFDEKQIRALEQYMVANKREIINMAKQIRAMDAFLK